MSASSQSGNSILVIHGSARRESDTAKCIQFTFSRTDHTYLDLNDYKIEDYNYDEVYSTSDQFLEVVDAMQRHRIILFATPVYWYSMSGKMKNLFDRFTDIVSSRKEIGRQLQGKMIALLAVGNDAELPEGFIVPFHETANYLSMKYIDAVYYSSARPMDSSKAMAAKAEFIRKLAQHMM